MTVQGVRVCGGSIDKFDWEGIDEIEQGGAQH